MADALLAHGPDRLPSPSMRERMLRHFLELFEEEVPFAIADTERKTHPELLDPVFVDRIRRRAAREIGTFADPMHSSHTWPGAESEMVKKMEGLVWKGKLRQASEVARNHIWEDLADRGAWLKGLAAVGHKNLGPCDYDCTFLVIGHPKKWNCSGVFQVTLDIDVKEVKDKDGNVLKTVSILNSKADEDRWDAWAVSKGGVIGHTTASHDPHGTGQRRRKYRWMIRGISYQDKQKVGHRLRQDWAREMGIDPSSAEFACLDPIIERGVQLQHGVRLRDQAQMDEFRLFTHEGPALDIDYILRDILWEEHNAEVAARIKAERKQILASYLPTTMEVRHEVPAGDLTVQGRAMLLRHSPATRAGDPNLTFLAIRKLKGLGLTREQSWELLQEWNLRCEPPWDLRQLRDKLNRGFATARVEVGSLARRTVGGVS
jgi:hypothetical protein